MQLVSKCNKRNWFWLCVIDIYSKYAWVIPLKGKKNTNPFQKVLVKSKFAGGKSNKKRFLQDHGIKMY